jgi:hypothetical protein
MEDIWMDVARKALDLTLAKKHSAFMGLVFLDPLSQAIYDRALELQAEVQELDQLFELQHTRTVEADKLWREAHPGNDFVIPDLGRLVEWLLEERAVVKESLTAAYARGWDDMLNHRRYDP